MIKVVIFYLVLLSFLFFSSCEEVVDIPLKNASPAIVIDGTITNTPGPYTVKISQTTNYYSPARITGLSGALVFIDDHQGHQWHFIEKSPGFYQNNGFKGTPGITYTLNVSLHGKEYKATSLMENPVLIDSLAVRYFPGSRFAEKGYYIILFFTDPPEKGNYYRIKMYKGSRPNIVIQVLDDELANGNRIKYFLFGADYQSGDTAVVELQSIDKGVFEYLLTLSYVTAFNTSETTSTPANPTTNFSGDALGYFGALAISRDTLVIPTTQ